VAFVDEEGRVVSADEIAILLVRHVLHQPGEKVVYDIKLSDRLRAAVEDRRGIPLIERSGHTFLKRRMILEDCLIGCEVSGHYFFRELHGGDDGLFAALVISELLAQEGSMTRLRQSIPPLHLTPDLRMRPNGLSFQEIALRLRKSLAPVNESTLDGLRVETADGVVLIRQSVTEPAITMRIEGHSAEALERLITTSLNAVPELASQVREQLFQEAG
jgi:phosphomannomutase